MIKSISCFLAFIFVFTMAFCLSSAAAQTDPEDLLYEARYEYRADESLPGSGPIPVQEQWDVPVRKVSLSERSMKLEGGKRFTLIAEVQPEDASNRTVTFTSLNPSVASVDEAGLVTTWRKGKAKIVARSVSNPEKVAVCMVTVTTSPLIKFAPDGSLVTGIQVHGNAYNLYSPVSSHVEASIAAYFDSLGNNRGERIVKRAAEYLGISYADYDCSHLTRVVYSYVGLYPGGRSDAQGKRSRSRIVEKDELLPGDLVFFRHPEGYDCGCGSRCRRYMGIHHVGIYAGIIDNCRYIIDASSYIGRIVIRSWDGGDVGFAQMIYVFGAHRW